MLKQARLLIFVESQIYAFENLSQKCYKNVVSNIT